MLVHHILTESTCGSIARCYTVLVIELRVVVLVMEILLLLDEIRPHHHVGVHLLLQSGHLHKLSLLLSGLHILHFLVKRGVVHRL